MERHGMGGAHFSWACKNQGICYSLDAVTEAAKENEKREGRHTSAQKAHKGRGCAVNMQEIQI